MKQRPGVLKRQREVARMARQKEKGEKRAQRKLDKEERIRNGEPAEESESEGPDEEE